MINRSLLRKELEPGLNTIFGLNYKQHPEEWKKIFSVESSNRAYEEDQGVYGFGAAALKSEGSSIQYDTAGEMWTARYTMSTIALGFSITMEAVQDNLYGNIASKFAKELARSLQYTKEVRGANVLNNGFDANFVGGDGVQLYSTAHPLAGGGTFSNTLATPADLSETAVEDALTIISRFVDERGKPVRVDADRLIIPNDLRWEAQRIFKSALRSGTPDNDTNALRDFDVMPGGIHMNHYLTDTDAWHIITNCGDGYKHFNRMAVETSMEEEQNTLNMLYRAVERYAFGFTDPRCGFASAGA